MKQTKRILIALLTFCLVLTGSLIRAEAAEIDSYPEIAPDTRITVTIENGGDKAYFRFVPEYTESYTFTAFSNSDTFGHLYDSEMNQLKGNDDDGEGSNFAVTYTLEAGQTYVFAARYYSNTATGSFDVILQANHDAVSEVITPATCTEDGLMGYTCTICGQSYTGVIPATGHSYESAETVAPTCTEPGEMTHTCTVCGFVMTEEIPALGHSYDEGVVTTPHTCTEDGVKTYTCTVCGYTNEKVLFAAHILAEDASGCDLCGEGCLASGTCGTNAQWALYKDGLLAIWGSKEMYRGDWNSNTENILRVVILDGITSIGESAFAGFSSLTSIDIPDSVTFINNYAFEDCSTLTNIGLPDEITSIGRYVFSGCANLTCIDMPEKLASIGDSAFSGCSGLTSIDIPDGVTSIGRYAFNGCSSLTSIVLPDRLAFIDSGTFNYCSSLTSIDIPDSVTTIGSEAFEECSSLTSIDIPDGVTYIGMYAFNCCSSLTNIEIPDSVTSIDAYAFQSCRSLISIDLPDGITSIAYRTFIRCSNLISVDLPDSITSIAGEAFAYCSSLTTVTFKGDAPSMYYDTFDGVTATAYYPAGNATWTESVRQNYEGKITWVPYYNVFEDGTDTEIDPGEEAVIHIDADHTTLTGVYVDGELVDPSNYTVTEGSTIITFKAEYLARLRGGEHEVAVEFEDGFAYATITTSGPAYTPGDINNDGKVNNKDLTRLFQYLSNWEVEVVEEALDINGDGKVNNKDLTRLFQYLSNWDVEIF